MSDAVREVELLLLVVEAVTVTVYVPGGVPGSEAEAGSDPPLEPHAAIPSVKPVASAAIRMTRIVRIPHRARPQPRLFIVAIVRQSMHASHTHPRASVSGEGPCRLPNRGGLINVIPVLGATVGTLTVNWLGAVGVTCTDEEFGAALVPVAHGPISDPAGAIEQDKFTVPVNPPAEATSMLKVAVCPGWIGAVTAWPFPDARQKSAAAPLSGMVCGLPGALSVS